ncbi:MAG: S1C family serine protease [Clostridia bacterium]|nr:S1C family serine protease [Clostridia bacterium]
MNDNEYGFNPTENNEPEKTEEKPAEENAYQQANPYTEPESATPPQPENNYSENNSYNSQNPYSGYNSQPNYSQNHSEPTYSPYSDNQFNNRPPQQNYQYMNGANAPYVEADVKKKKSKKGFVAFLAAVVAVFVCVAILLTAITVVPKLKGTDNKKAAKKDTTQIQISDAPSLSAASKSSAEIASEAQKFNVGILVYGQSQSFLTSSTTENKIGEGSGIVMGEDKSGTYTYILTCAHVIKKAKSPEYKMTVQDCDNKTYDAEMVGFDVKTDIGVIKIKKTGLTAAVFGDSSNLVIGQQVYAIGNPGGTDFFGSFTNGMISAIDRPISSESGYEMECIQHTTPINSGNSGGALLNESGQVIGINSSKIVSTGYEGMAFSIPITDAKPIIDDIIANGYVTNRPKLGISYLGATSRQDYGMVVRINRLPAGSLVIAKISDDSALIGTKAQVGDIITKVNGKELTTADVLLDTIQNGKVGDELKLTICRPNDDYSVSEFTINVKLVEDDGTGSELEQETTTNFFEQFGF